MTAWLLVASTPGIDPTDSSRKRERKARSRTSTRTVSERGPLVCSTLRTWGSSVTRLAMVRVSAAEQLSSTMARHDSGRPCPVARPETQAMPVDDRRCQRRATVTGSISSASATCVHEARGLS